MKTIWPAATIAIAVTSYFAWSNYTAPQARPATQPVIDDCHRLAGEIEAIHDGGGIISTELLGRARGCAVSFGSDWAATGGDRAAALRAEGAARVR